MAVISTNAIIDDILHKEKKFASCKLISRRCSVPYQQAKSELESYFQSKSKSGDLNAVYYLSGYTLTGDLKVYKSMLVRDNDLQSAKNNFDNTVSCHIYGVQCAPVLDIATVLFSDGLSDKDDAELTLVRCANSKPREVRPSTVGTKSSTTASTTAPAVANELKASVKPKYPNTEEKPKSTKVDEKPRNAKVEEKPTSVKGDVNPKSAKVEEKPPATKEKEKKSSSSSSSAINKFFQKTSTPVVSENNGKSSTASHPPKHQEQKSNGVAKPLPESVKKRSLDNGAEAVEAKIRKVTPKKTAAVKTDKDDKKPENKLSLNSDIFSAETDSSPENSPAKNTRLSVKQEQKSPRKQPERPSKKLKVETKRNASKKEIKGSKTRFFDESDESEEEDNRTIIPPTPEPTVPVMVTDARIQKRTRNTYCDEDGYLVCKTVMQTEVIPSNKKALTEANKQQKPAAQSSTKKSDTSPKKQARLTAFFKTN